MQVKDPEAIRRRRQRLKFSQRELAYLCRCSQNTISLIEKGEMTTMSEDLAKTLASRLGVDWEDLFVSRVAAGVRRATRDASSTRQAVAG